VIGAIPGIAGADETAPANSVSGIPPGLSTNQRFIEDARAGAAFDIEDLTAVLRFVFARLADRVRVYPTENYYYFRFRHGGIDYAGNLRLAARDRDRGILHFAYFAAGNLWVRLGKMHYKPLSKNDGVSVTKAGRLKYAVSFEGRRVIFQLNDLSDVKPPPGTLRENETYLGPIFDESGLQFFLVFNRDLKLFHYVLNEAAPLADLLEPSRVSARISIGRRSGFAFYQDHFLDRKLLIGVHAANVFENNYYDGPFDQLPDNFISSDALMRAIEAYDPSVAGAIDRYGYFKSGVGRYLIGPYMQYSSQAQLVAFDRCASNRTIPPEQYGRCFSLHGGGRR